MKFVMKLFELMSLYVKYVVIGVIFSVSVIVVVVGCVWMLGVMVIVVML